jgi:hypothetical protein
MNDVKITADNLIERILAHFPELQESYKQQQNTLEGADGLPSNYLFVGNIFQPRIAQEITSGKITSFLKRCAAFIEQVCVDNDLEALNAVWIRIFEWLIFHPEELRTIWPVLGPASKANIRDAAQRWSVAGRYYGKTQNLPEENIPDWD